MRVTAGDKVDAVNLRRDLSVAHLVSLRIRIIAKMRHAEDQCASLLLAQKLHHAARHAHRIKILKRLKIIRSDQTFGTNAQTEKPNPHAADFLHRVGLHSAFQGTAAHVIVGRNDIEIRE